MANVSVYLEALHALNSPATVREVHDKAREMFGSGVKGDRTSARQSLERYALRGDVEKDGSRYILSMKRADPLSALATENRTLKAEVERLKARIAELEARS
jgi:hypothetical protein